LISDSNEYQRLTKLYEGLGDDELSALFLEVEDLTEMAQDVLRSELASRRLETPRRVETDEREEELEGPYGSDGPGRFAPLSSPDCVWEFRENEDAQAAGQMLAEAGIEYDLILSGTIALDQRPPRLAVLPDDALRAGELLSKPIPEEFREFVRTQDQFALPKCPRCKSEDPLLDCFDPVNRWSCEVCGHTWAETLPG
jgi:hypothetical protein